MAEVEYDSTGSRTSYPLSQATVHPAWQADPNWFDTPDIALVRVNQAIRVNDASGNAVREFKRRVYIGPSSFLAIKKNPDLYARVAACGVHTNGLTCGEADRLRADNGYVVVEGNSWLGDAHYEPGDSGGPHLVLTNLYGTPEGPRLFAEHGIVIGVISGPAILESWSWARPCPCDYYGTATYPLEKWLDAVAGSGVFEYARGPLEVSRMVAGDVDSDGAEELITSFVGAATYVSQDGQRPGGGAGTAHGYVGPGRPATIVPFGRGVITEFQSPRNQGSWGIYRSPDGLNLGGGGATTREYDGAARLDALIPFQQGAIAAFYNPSNGRPWGIYRSPDGRHLGGGGNTVRVYNGSARVDEMASYQGGVLTAFYNRNSGNSWGIYRSPDGNNLSGGGATGTVYTGSARVDALVPFQGGVLTAFYSRSSGRSWGIYRSPDGSNLGGGGSTALVYNGGGRVDAMIPFRTGVITSFYGTGGSGWGVYFSPDGNSVGGGGNTIRVYDGPKRLNALVPFRGGVIAAFERGAIYFSPDGLNLNGGGNTTLLYPR